MYVGSCNLIGQYVVFSSFPRLNVEDSRSKKRLGQKTHPFPPPFYLNGTAVVLYIISDSSIYLVSVTNFALRTEFWTCELFFVDLDRTRWTVLDYFCKGPLDFHVPWPWHSSYSRGLVEMPDSCVLWHLEFEYSSFRFMDFDNHSQRKIQLNIGVEDFATSKGIKKIDKHNTLWYITKL